MFTVSLVTVKVGEAHFNLQIHEPRVLHLGLAEGGEVVRLCPFDGRPVMGANAADVRTFQISFSTLSVRSTHFCKAARQTSE